MSSSGWVLFVSIFACCLPGRAQEMSPEKLKEVISELYETLVGERNSYQILYKARPLFCIYDEDANRMRMISPSVERKDIGEEELLNALVANFHSALDVKYALSDEIIWSVFVHPLRELSEHQVRDAIEQVYNSATTFGTTYSSTGLVFPGNTKRKEKAGPKKLIEKSSY